MILSFTYDVGATTTLSDCCVLLTVEEGESDIS